MFLVPSRIVYKARIFIVSGYFIGEYQRLGAYMGGDQDPISAIVSITLQNYNQ